MKQFIVDRHTSQTPTLNEVPNEVIPIYDTKTDAEADLANLTAGQIIATKDEGNELSVPVDVVQDGNMHAVTSNAVAKEIQDLKHSIIYIPVPYSGISWIIPQNMVQSMSQVDGVSVEGNIVQVTFKVYEGISTFTVQLSYGTTDAMIQQMSGDGRVGFSNVTQNDTDYTVDGVWKVYTRNVSIPQGSPIFGIGPTGANIGITGLNVVQ